MYLFLKTFFWYCLVVYVEQNIFKSVLTEFNNINIIKFIKLFSQFLCDSNPEHGNVHIL